MIIFNTPNLEILFYSSDFESEIQIQGASGNFRLETWKF